MENLSYIGLSRQVSLWKQMNATANNMANMSTPGYKAQKILFEEYINEKNTAKGDASISQVTSSLDFNDLSQGPLQSTSNPFDAAINGEGYFSVKTAAGTKYTRDGSFQLNKQNELVTAAGYQVLDDSGAPITIPQNSVNIIIGKTGTISDENGEIGKLKVVKFSNDTTIIPIGDNLFHAGNAKEEVVSKPQIEQGMIEMSNVEPVTEMNNMIQIQRMFEATQNMLKNDYDRQRNVIKVLTDV